ncbi:type IV secretion protein Dot [Legionella norrlandica]|uniref:Type IV secretion protein Dot n=1 Tax=Legionella norrlandica TaxID=1498499 RepID=A0A0A2T7C4_9GAMM|nr:DUF456 domain-containing protein [Legionella norrlandica]KGP63323.1 type IV secretion protein Dot [Legionella norrlandica]
MSLSKEIQEASLKSLIHDYKDQLNETDIKLLEFINNLAAADDIPLYTQDQSIINFLIKTIKESKSEQNSDLQNTSHLIYGLVIREMEVQSALNRQRHLQQGRFDEEPLHLRNERDQLQDHDMTLLMPKSQGNIDVMAVINRYDPHSANAIIEALANDIYNPEFQHIVIPVGPGHWRGVYLTKPMIVTDEVKYDLELFDPYGPQGAATLDDYILDLLARCGIPKERINIRHTGPKLPRGDAYSCGDFTCAHSHKKMKEFGAPKTSYNQILIDTLDNLGNENDVLRLATREETRKLIEKNKINSPIPPKVPDRLPNKDDENKDEIAKGQSKEEARDSSSEKKSKLSLAARIGLFIGGSTLVSGGIGAVIGGLLGFFLLPGFGAPIGAVIGAAIGVGAGLLVTGMASLFWIRSRQTSNTQSSENNTMTQEAPGLKSHKLDKSHKQSPEIDKEPIHSPPLFSSPAKETLVEDDSTDELKPGHGPK